MLLIVCTMPDEKKTKAYKVEWRKVPDMLLMAAALCSMAYILVYGKTLDWFYSGSIRLAVGMLLISCGAFLLLSLRHGEKSYTSVACLFLPQCMDVDATVPFNNGLQFGKHLCRHICQAIHAHQQPAKCLVERMGDCRMSFRIITVHPFGRGRKCNSAPSSAWLSCQWRHPMSVCISSIRPWGCSAT